MTAESDQRKHGFPPGAPLVAQPAVTRGFPYLKIEKLQEIHFMFCDRYEIHIQAFVHFIDRSSSFFNPHLHEIIFEICTQICIK